MPNKWKIRLRSFWRDYARPFLFILVIFTAFRSSVADWNDVPTGSMKPSILEGDRIFVNKLAYDLKVPYTTWRLAKWSNPHRGDVVVFFSPEDGTRLVKRVVGVPGDTVAMDDEQLFINEVPASYGPLDGNTIEDLPADQRLSHRFGSEQYNGRQHPVMINPRVQARRTFGPVKLGNNEYFMMGDNRDNSRDSRYFGTVKRDLIVGRATNVVLSLDRGDYYLPRWDRFFKTLP
jgi:signal peptidase I